MFCFCAEDQFNMNSIISNLFMIVYSFYNMKFFNLYVEVDINIYYNV